MKSPLTSIFQGRFYRIALVCVVSFLAINCSAQFQISGKITDSAGIGLPSATVTLQEKISGLVLGYSITDKTGVFTIALDNKPGGQLWLYVNAVGYYQDSMAITSQFSGLLLRPSPVAKGLPPVTVKNRRSFLNNKADTSSYKTEDFIHKQDRTIEDVLRKIPGIEIDGSGKISHNGRPISNFYIDGDDIVNDRYNIATRSIRPEMVDKVQVIENHNPIKVLETATLSNNTALNLSLKEEARMALMGNAELGLGNSGTYKLNVDLFSFKKQFKFINQLKANNAGINIAGDLAAHNLADLIKKLEQNSTPPFLGLGEMGNPQVGQQRYLFNETGLITLNNSFSTKNETQIKLNINYLSDRQNRIAASNSTFALSSGNIVYSEEKHQDIRAKHFDAQLTITANRKGYYFNNVLLARSARPSGIAKMRLNGSDFLQEYTRRNWEISNELSAIKRNGNKITEFNSFIRYQPSPEDLRIVPGVNDSVFNRGESYRELAQGINLNGFFTHTAISYRIANPFFLQNYKLGVVAQWQQLESGINTTNHSGQVKPLNDSFINRLSWDQYKIYAKAEYDWINGPNKLTVSIPFYLHYIQKKPFQTDIQQDFTKLVFSPLLRWRYDIGTQSYVSASYQFNASPTGIQENYPAYILSNYLLLQSWKLPVVTNSLHIANIGWSGQKAVKMLAAYVNIGYSAGKNGFLPKYYYLYTLQTQEHVQGVVHTSNRYANAGVSKYIFSMRTHLSGRVTLQQNRYEQVQENQLIRFSDMMQTFSLKAQSKIGQWLTGSYGMMYMRNRSRNLTQDSLPEQKAAQLVQQVEVNIFPVADLTIRFNGDYYYTGRDNAKLISSFFTDIHVQYQLRKYKVELGLDCINLTGKDYYTISAVSGNRGSQTSFPLRPSMIMGTIRVRF